MLIQAMPNGPPDNWGGLYIRICIRMCSKSQNCITVYLCMCGNTLLAPAADVCRHCHWWCTLAHLHTFTVYTCTVSSEHYHSGHLLHWYTLYYTPMRLTTLNYLIKAEHYSVLYERKTENFTAPKSSVLYCISLVHSAASVNYIGFQSIVLSL